MHPDKKLNLVFWAFPSWNGDYVKSTVELAKELALKHNVLYIDYAYTIKDILTARRNTHIPFKHIIGIDESLYKVDLDNGGKLNVLSLPPIIPFNWTSNKTIYNLIQKINQKMISKRIELAMKILYMKPDAVINAFNPFFGDAALHEFKGSPVIYYCYDNIDAANWASVHGARLEKQFMQQADAVIFSSESLQANKACKADSYVVNNGVDLRNFKPIETPINKHIHKSRKVVGYTGSVDDRLDYDLLAQVIGANPEIDFRFIGRVVSAESCKLKRFSNFQSYGAVAPASLPAMMKDFDIGIIPFRKNDFTKNIYPMKVNEYLALGIPVVSTGFAQLDDLQGYMQIADSADTFSSLIHELIANDSSDKKLDREGKAHSNSWKSKAAEFENILLKYAA